MSPFAKHRDSDKIVVSLSSTDPGVEAGFTIKETTFSFPNAFSTQIWRYDTDDNYTKISDYREEENYTPPNDTVSGNVQLDCKRFTDIDCKLIITGNLTLDQPLNSETTRCMCIWLIQNGIGGHTINFNSTYFKLKTGTTFNTGANDRNLIQFRQDNGIFYESHFEKDWV